MDKPICDRNEYLYLTIMKPLKSYKDIVALYTFYKIINNSMMMDYILSHHTTYTEDIDKIIKQHMQDDEAK